MPSPAQSTQLAALFRLLGEVNRLRRVLACLAAPVAVGALAERLGLSASLVSHPSRLLRASSIVRAERRGKQVFYVAADHPLSTLLAPLLAHIAAAEGKG